uniref:Uncharacterized protein n=1 Tax=Candidatus Kentrum sp. LPFa TaxID=2126335 RepID=A0A450XBI5_9GAMM|nr:MAG: hypothetical protein BECKLPF1236A_GA0070988_1003514 [Candidatus Kentron sp. LPFa]VFK26642.1 MAG: hypothetical protein BECKLPF1236C_GA0070990_1003714 [Candidatus Kentron sp. LPFa]
MVGNALCSILKNFDRFVEDFLDNGIIISVKRGLIKSYRLLDMVIVFLEILGYGASWHLRSDLKAKMK